MPKWWAISWMTVTVIPWGTAALLYSLFVRGERLYWMCAGWLRTAPALRDGGTGERWALIGCYHPSQQNMFTGRLTPAMLDDVFADATKLAGIG